MNNLLIPETNINANKNAPVVANNKIQINCTAQKVWEILTAIDKWPEWQSDITSAELQGELKAGTAFKWKAGGLKFHSVLHTVKTNELFGWTGKTIGASAVHNWKIIEENNSTLVIVEESLDGIFPRLFKRKFQSTLEKGMIKSLNELKNACETS